MNLKLEFFVKIYFISPVLRNGNFSFKHSFYSAVVLKMNKKKPAGNYRENTVVCSLLKSLLYKRELVN